MLTREQVSSALMAKTGDPKALEKIMIVFDAMDLLGPMLGRIADPKKTTELMARVSNSIVKNEAEIGMASPELLMVIAAWLQTEIQAFSKNVIASYEKENANAN